MAMQPMAMYGLTVPPWDIAIPAESNIKSAFRITMAAIDPTAEPMSVDGDKPVPARATLKVIRQNIFDMDGEEDDSEEEGEEEEEEDDEEDDADVGLDVEKLKSILEMSSVDSEEDEDSGSSSDPAVRKARQQVADKALAAMLKLPGGSAADLGINGTKSAKAKGKMPATDEDDEDDEDVSDSEMSDDSIDEFVICTLDPEKNYQQPLDITIGEDEAVFFKVTGTHTIYLTGNYVEPAGPQNDLFDPDDDEELDYDLEPDSDEVDDEDDEEDEDELDDMEDPRITEIDVEDDEVPTLVDTIKKDTKKGKNKRAAEDSPDEADGLDAMISKTVKVDPTTTNGEQKLSKKQLKKMKKNDGTAGTIEEKKVGIGAPSSGKSDKKVQFAKDLEQGPTPNKAEANGTAKGKSSLGIKVIQGVTIDDKKLGTGAAAKAGDRIGMRYIGKLQKDNKVFDSNKKGKPFTFKLGSGEVIKGWDIGVAGMSVGGERRITIPAHLGYASQSMPGIPPNSTLVFDVKLVDINKGK